MSSVVTLVHPTKAAGRNEMPFAETRVAVGDAALSLSAIKK